MRTRIMNQYVVALNEGVRRKKALWRPEGRAQLESLVRGQFFPIFGTRPESPIAAIHERRDPLEVSNIAQNCRNKSANVFAISRNSFSSRPSCRYRDTIRV